MLHRLIPVFMISALGAVLFHGVSVDMNLGTTLASTLLLLSLLSLFLVHQALKKTGSAQSSGNDGMDPEPEYEYQETA